MAVGLSPPCACIIIIIAATPRKIASKDLVVYPTYSIQRIRSWVTTRTVSDPFVVNVLKVHHACRLHKLLLTNNNPRALGGTSSSLPHRPCRGRFVPPALHESGFHTRYTGTGRSNITPIPGNNLVPSLRDIVASAKVGHVRDSMVVERCPEQW